MLKQNLVRFGLGVILFMASTIAYGQTPDVIHYRGHLDVPGVVPPGTVQRQLTFNLYEMAGGGSPIWTETQTLDIYDGNFAAVLGSINSVTQEMFTGEYRYLGVQVGADPELTPRQRIAAVPYSMVAGHAIRAASADDADMLGGGKVSVGILHPHLPQYSVVNVNGMMAVQENATFVDSLLVGYETPVPQPSETMHVTTVVPEGQTSDRKRFMVSTSILYPSGSYSRWTHLVVDRLGDVQMRGSLDVDTSLNVDGPIYQRGGPLHPDYVFEDGYKINSIEEHAEKMWDAKHLPGVPPREYDEEGREMVEIGRQRTGILKELEIAHIYIEQLNKKIGELEKKIEKLEEKSENK